MKLSIKHNFGTQKGWKVRGALFSSELIFYILAGLAFMAAAYLNWPAFSNFIRAGAERFEMSSMSSAAALYSGLRADGANPSSVEDLLNGVSRADAIDNIPHVDLMSNMFGRWSNGNYTDMWGTAFQFTEDADGTNRRIVSAGPDRQFGTDDDIIVGY